MIDWNLRSRSHSCHKCSADFIDGERCNSAVAVFETIGPPIAAFAIRHAGEAGMATAED